MEARLASDCCSGILDCLPASGSDPEPCHLDHTVAGAHSGGRDDHEISPCHLVEQCGREAMASRIASVTPDCPEVASI
jgi:hypothetical protein